MSDCENEECEDSFLEEDEEKAEEVLVEDRKNAPKSMRGRYWTSWEEMKLIELWHSYQNEVTNLTLNLPVFKKIAEGMRLSGFHVIALEVRRKMNNMKNRYLTERRRMTSEQTTSDWSLFPLVHCLFAPKSPNASVNDMKEVINESFAEVQDDSEYSAILNEILSAQEDDANEIKFPTEDVPVTHSYAKAIAQVGKAITSRVRSIDADMDDDINNKTEDVKPLTEQYQNKQPISKFCFSNSSILIQRVTKEGVEQLRIENKRLAEECILNMKNLKQDEQKLRSIEMFMTQLMEQYTYLDKKLGLSK